MEDTEPTYLDDVEEARNRPDKSVLAIRTMCPGKLLASDVAFPEQVQHLWIDTDEIFSYLKADCDCRIMDACTKNLVNFTQLHTLKLQDVNLSSDLLTQFAQNSKNLTKIEFESHKTDETDDFEFDGEYNLKTRTMGPSKKEGLEAIFKIPTLKKIIFSHLHLSFFPKGPSNLSHIELNWVKTSSDDDEELQLIHDEYFANFSTHTNLTSVDITRRYNSPFKFSTLRLYKLKQLEELMYLGEFYSEDLKSLKLVFNLNLKYVYIKCDNTFRFKITSEDGEKWTIETENNGLVTVNSKEELLNLIDTFELTTL